MKINQESDWLKKFIFYFRISKCPKSLDRFQRRRFKLQVMKFMMVDNRIYKKSFDQTLLRCVTWDEAQRILHEFHYGLSRGNYSGPTTTTKILQARYYWPTMFQDSFKIA